MNRNLLRWIIVILMGLSLVFVISCPYLAEAELVTENGILPLSINEGGVPPIEENWIFDGKQPTSYEDSTIKVSFEYGEINHKLVSGPHRGKKVTDATVIARIKIQHVSQLRTAWSYDTSSGSAAAKAEAIAKEKNAVVAMNGDFYKQTKEKGYTVRQGEVVRDTAENSKNYVFDMLIIDSEGDFHPVYSATTESIKAYVDENLTPLGRTVLDTFNIGPVLVLNGEVQDVSVSEVTKHGGREGLYQWSTPCHRIAIVQTGHLEYAIIYTDSKGNRESGLTLQELAEYIAEQCPGAWLAYNLDGGGSANLVAHNKRIHKNSYLRNISDIIYFASAESLPEEE